MVNEQNEEKHKRETDLIFNLANRTQTEFEKIITKGFPLISDKTNAFIGLSVITVALTDTMTKWTEGMFKETPKLYMELTKTSRNILSDSFDKTIATEIE